MNIALCYESVVPDRGGCETYIADLARRLAHDRHELHLYACQYDTTSLPANLVFHRLPPARGPRFLRPWRFAAACDAALRDSRHEVVVGFVKTWRQDVLIPQGGLHMASVEHNRRKYPQPWQRLCARVGKWLDPCHWSYLFLERKQFVHGRNRLLIVAPSAMVKNHLQQYYQIDPDRVHVVHNAIDPARFVTTNRLRQRQELRERLRIASDSIVGLFVGHNYRLKGLDPLLRAVTSLPSDLPFELIVCGSAHVANYQRCTQRLGIDRKVHFLGFESDVRHCFFAADFLVHPTFYDPCSLVVLEALACALPVITTRFNGAAELLHEPQDGYIIADPHDYRTLAARIQQLCDRRMLPARADAARRAAAAWTFEDHYLALQKVFAKAAERKAAA